MRVMMCLLRQSIDFMDIKKTSMMFASIIIACLTTGCINVRAPQVDSIVRLFDSAEIEQNPYLWRLNFGGYTQTIMYIRAERGQGFANEFNDIMTFDDKIIRRIAQVNQRKVDLRFVDQPNENNQSDLTIRQVMVSNKLFTTLTCEPWRDNSVMKLSQVCYDGKKSYTNTLHYIDNKLMKIAMALPYFETQLTLTKL